MPALPQILALLFARDRESFTLPVESYDHWVLLGSQSGSFRYAFGQEKEGLCEPGEFLICPSGVPLRRRALGRISFCFIRFLWKAEPSLWKGKHGLLDVARMESTLSYLEHLHDHPGAEGEEAWANHLLVDLLNQSLHERRMAAIAPGKVPDRLMIQVSEKLRRELADPSSLDELAGRLRLTPSQLSRRFTAAFGINPSAYRTRLRMQESRRMLLETSLSIEEIAEACGFENAFYFSRVFTRQTGQPPSRFRKSRRV